jgi:hypothetical protein
MKARTGRLTGVGGRQIIVDDPSGNPVEDDPTHMYAHKYTGYRDSLSTEGYPLQLFNELAYRRKRLIAERVACRNCGGRQLKLMHRNEVGCAICHETQWYTVARVEPVKAVDYVGRYSESRLNCADVNPAWVPSESVPRKHP